MSLVEWCSQISDLMASAELQSEMRDFLISKKKAYQRKFPRTKMISMKSLVQRYDQITSEVGAKNARFVLIWLFLRSRYRRPISKNFRGIKCSL